MKWFFSILLIANLGMFIWLYPQQDEASRQAMVPEDVGQLPLVGEPLPPPEPDLADISNADTTSGQTSRSPTVDASEQNLVPPMVITADEVAEQEPVQAPPQIAAPEPQPEPMCGTLGVFEKRSQAELVSVRLLADGAKTDITAETTNNQAGYWVLIPPQESRVAAIAIAKRLEEAGVSDLWRFTSGELAHAISLGLFRDDERAQARSDKINEMGFESEVRPRYREQTRYWLNYRYQNGSRMQAEYWQELQEGLPELERNEKTCP